MAADDTTTQYHNQDPRIFVSWILHTSHFNGLSKSDMSTIRRALEASGALIAGGSVLNAYAVQRFLNNDAAQARVPMRCDIKNWMESSKFKSIPPEAKYECSICKNVAKSMRQIRRHWKSLCPYEPFLIKDFDIYVHKDRFRVLLKHLQDIKYRVTSITLASPYDMSFFRKNGIISRLHLRREGTPTPIDLLIVNRDPLKVVTNFDLRACQIWWDGGMVQCTHPNDIDNLSTSLNDEYVPTFKEGNKFLRKRMCKYLRRGFQIFVKDKAMILQDINLCDTPSEFLSTSKSSKIGAKKYDIDEFLQYKFAKYVLGHSIHPTVVLERIIMKDSDAVYDIFYSRLYKYIELFWDITGHKIAILDKLRSMRQCVPDACHINSTKTM